MVKMEKAQAQESLIGFCSAPWTDCLSYADGDLKACDRNIASFGNWQKDGLRKTWESPAFQDFRKAIREGRYPDRDCASCHNNGTQRTAESSLLGAYSIHYETVRRLYNLSGEQHIPELAALHPLLSLKRSSPQSEKALELYFSYLNKLERRNLSAEIPSPELRLAITKLRVIGETLEDYLKGELLPRRLGTFRQSQLQAKCTARCVMCAGKYTGEIVNGPTMDSKYTDEAFAAPEDITDFWCNGSEYLFYKEWKKVALMLRKEGIRMRVSTNGILLTEPTIDFMIENDLLGFVTLSLDAATKETMESTRIRVNYDKNMQRIRYLLRRATEAGQSFEFVAAFVMMKRNLHELPAFVRLMKSLMPENCVPIVYVLCQPLENFNVEGYREFVHKEHHMLLGEGALRKIFADTLEAEKETGITVTFYNQHLRDFVAEGMPFPKFFPRQMDADIFLRAVKNGEPLWSDAEIDAALAAVGGQHGKPSAQEAIETFIKNFVSSNPIVSETMCAIPEFRDSLIAEVPRYAKDILRRLEGETRTIKLAGGEITVSRLPLQDTMKGDLVFSAGGGCAGRVVTIRGAHALLSNGSIIRLGQGIYKVTTPVAFEEKGAAELTLQKLRLFLLPSASKTAGV